MATWGTSARVFDAAASVAFAGQAVMPAQTQAGYRAPPEPLHQQRRRRTERGGGADPGRLSTGAMSDGIRDHFRYYGAAVNPGVNDAGATASDGAGADSAYGRLGRRAARYVVASDVVRAGRAAAATFAAQHDTVTATVADRRRRLNRGEGHTGTAQALTRALGGGRGGAGSDDRRNGGGARNHSTAAPRRGNRHRHAIVNGGGGHGLISAPHADFAGRGAYAAPVLGVPGPSTRHGAAGVQSANASSRAAAARLVRAAGAGGKRRTRPNRRAQGAAARSLARTWGGTTIDSSGANGSGGGHSHDGGGGGRGSVAHGGTMPSASVLGTASGGGLVVQRRAAVHSDSEAGASTGAADGSRRVRFAADIVGRSERVAAAALADDAGGGVGSRHRERILTSQSAANDGGTRGADAQAGDLVMSPARASARAHLADIAGRIAALRVAAGSHVRRLPIALGRSEEAAVTVFPVPPPGHVAVAGAGTGRVDVPATAGVYGGGGTVGSGSGWTEDRQGTSLAASHDVRAAMTSQSAATTAAAAAAAAAAGNVGAGRARLAPVGALTGVDASAAADRLLLQALPAIDRSRTNDRHADRIFGGRGGGGGGGRRSTGQHGGQQRDRTLAGTSGVWLGDDGWVDRATVTAYGGGGGGGDDAAAPVVMQRRRRRARGMRQRHRASGQTPHGSGSSTSSGTTTSKGTGSYGASANIGGGSGRRGAVAAASLVATTRAIGKPVVPPTCAATPSQARVWAERAASCVVNSTRWTDHNRDDTHDPVRTAQRAAELQARLLAQSEQKRLRERHIGITRVPLDSGDGYDSAGGLAGATAASTSALASDTAAAALRPADWSSADEAALPAAVASIAAGAGTVAGGAFAFGQRARVSGELPARWDERDGGGNTALHRACMSGNADAVARLLLEVDTVASALPAERVTDDEIIAAALQGHAPGANGPGRREWARRETRGGGAAVTGALVSVTEPTRRGTDASVTAVGQHAHGSGAAVASVGVSNYGDRSGPGHGHHGGDSTLARESGHGWGPPRRGGFLDGGVGVRGGGGGGGGGGAVDVASVTLAAALVNAQNDAGATPLHAAASRGLVPIVSLLCDHALVVPNLLDDQGATPLFRAAARGHTQCALRILAADPLTQALHWRATGALPLDGHVPSHGEDIAYLTPQDAAQKFGHTRLVGYLRRASERQSAIHAERSAQRRLLVCCVALAGVWPGNRGHMLMQALPAGVVRQVAAMVD